MKAPDLADILIVDDRVENLIALEAILEQLGQRIERAASGEEALRNLLVKDYAVIVLDVQMPGLNGFETAQLIKSRERSKHIPIIFLTAISKEERYVFQGYSVGAVDYMFKPFEPDILRSKVAVFVELYQKTRQLQKQGDLLREAEHRELTLQHAAELAASEARLAEIVNSAMDAIISVDAEHRITVFNAAAERMFARSAADAIGVPINELFAPDFREECLSRILAARNAAESGNGAAPGSSAVEACVGIRPPGETFPVEMSVSALVIGEERVYTVIARDVTERRRAEEALRSQAVSLATTSEELRAANDELHRRQIELEKAMGARSRFYASMSHELRTPINAILGYNTLLLDNIYGPLTEQQTHSLRRVHEAAKHLLELVEDVLSLSKIEAGKLELLPQPVALPSLVEDLFVTVHPLAEEAGSEITIAHEGESRPIVTDLRRVRQILLNLLSNAIKFGEGKPIHVLTRMRGDGGAEVEVTDQGVGIADADLPRIFDEFVQLTRAEGHQGTGLGLPISRRLAEMLSGSLDVESVPGKGSTFRLVLPGWTESELRNRAVFHTQDHAIIQG
ncbi:MAG: hybrid sensor histidine kinase/response regulator [Gemmatimonadaceae bacterium]